MATNYTPYLVAGSLAAVLMLHKRQSTVKYMSGIRVYIGKVTLKGNYIIVQLHIQNPNSGSVTIRSVVGDLFMNDWKVGNVSKFMRQEVKGNAESVLSLNVKPKVLNIFNTFTDLVTKKLAIKFYFNGNMNANNAVVPVQVTYTL